MNAGLIVQLPGRDVGDFFCLEDDHEDILAKEPSYADDTVFVCHKPADEVADATVTETVLILVPVAGNDTAGNETKGKIMMTSCAASD